ncbi:MAG: HAMP domain-containing histidine kinase [Eubacterium sp.]|nr:HAMP domain-containing histidine kinase [Eubacterium sp.]
MIKKLRWRFISISMFSIAIVLTVIIGSINIANYYNINNNINTRIELIINNGGSFPDLSGANPNENSAFSNDLNPGDLNSESADASGDNLKPSDKPDDMPQKPNGDNLQFKNGLSEESQYDTRYFTVILNKDGTVSSVNTGNISAISTTDASEYATTLFEKGRFSGIIDNYKYKGVYTEDEDGNDIVMYVFINCERELLTFENFLLASIGISLAGILVVFILVYFFSKSVVRPMVESYNKQKRFITDASHEIKTPLTIIDANTEILEMTGGENEWTVSIKKQIKRLTSLTEKLVFLARMDEEGTGLEMFDFNLSDAVLDMAEPFTAVAETHGKSLELNIAPDIIYHGDEKNIRQLISLLLDNAMKYSSENGEISLELKAAGKDKILSVKNSVDEIKVGSHNELFERFYRTDLSHNSKTGGFGIGLSVVYSIVEAHKGKITAESKDGKSIIFKVVL